MTLTRKGNMIVLGDDEVRIEEGPVLKTAIATEELLSDAYTAQHYYEGVRDRVYNDALGKPYTVPVVGVGADGEPIKLGEEMKYLDHGGHENPGSRCFYIYRKREVDPTTPLFKNGEKNPHYVDERVRNGANLADDGTPPNRTHFTYVFDEVATRKTEEDAVAYGRKLLGEKG